MVRIGAFILLLTSLAFAAPKDVAKTTHYYTLNAPNSMMNGSCSGTAISPHSLLSASHCETPTSTMLIDGGKATIDAVLRDGNDHTIFLLSGITFTDIAKVNWLGTRMEQGDRVYVFGNPNGWKNLYREGYVSGDETLGTTPQTVYDFNGYFGDSGAGMFDRHDKLVNVVSMVQSDFHSNTAVKFVVSMPLQFTKDQIDEAMRHGLKK